MSTDIKFEETVRNLLQMKPKPHEEASDDPKSQRFEEDQSSNRRPTKARNSGEY